LKFKGNIIACLLVILLGAVLYAAGQEQGKWPETSSATDGGPRPGDGSTPIHSPARLDAAARRVEGEKRFHANCSRCHMAPHKFPPRMMATIERHMRVRAMITAEDMQLILGYMTE
jgi:mono/diheme cytochrome c family protein